MSDDKKIYTRIDSKLYEQMTEVVEKRGITKKQFIADAICNALDEIDIHHRKVNAPDGQVRSLSEKCKKLSAENMTLVAEKAQLCSERDAVQNDLAEAHKDIERLKDSYAAAVDEGNAEYAELEAKIKFVEGKLNESKCAYRVSVESRSQAEDRMERYKKRGLFARIFNCDV